MNKPATVLSFLAVMQAATLSAGSITVSSGHVQTAGNQVVTGNGSRAEAVVDQRGSVVRLGANTTAQVGDRGNVSLSKGVVLVSSGDGFLRRPAVQVVTPQGDVTVRGSAIVAALPDGSVKMTCLEGSVRGGLGGQSMALNPGNLIVQRPEGTRDAVQVNLNTLTHSTPLLDSAHFKPLTAAPEIHQEVAQQAQVFASTLTLARNDANTTQSDNRTVEVKSSGPGLLARIFGASSTGKTAENSTGAVLQIQGSSSGTTNVATTSPEGTGLLRISGAVSGSNVLINGATAPSGVSGSSITLASVQNQPVVASTAHISGGSQLVIANGATQQMAQGALNGATVVNAGVISGTGASLVRSGAGVLTLNTQGGGPMGATLNNGTLVLQGAAAQQYLNGNLTVNGQGGTLTPTSNSGGVITFQPAPPPVAP